MDLTAMAHQLGQHMTVPVLVMFVLLVISEVLGSVGSIKASSIYQVLQALLMTIKDQVWPKASS